MRTYKEYPIRCKDCNEQIACFSEKYEQLVRKYTTNLGVTGSSAIEKALNELKIMEPCSRIAFMNPTTVFFDVEDRQLIEGLRDTDVLIPPPRKKIFATKPAPLSIEYETTTTAISTASSIEDRLKIIPDEELRNRELSLIGDSLKQEFIYPTVVGIPTINPILGVDDEVVGVGIDNKVRILNGRTYLAR